MHRRFEQQAARRPHEIAAACGSQKITYADLNSRANRLARYLRRVVPSPSTQIGIFLEPCLGTVVCLLAALKAGNPYIPIDPNTEPSQIAGILAETEALTLLPSESTPACLPARRARTISIESEIDSIEIGSPSNLLQRNSADGLGSVAFYAATGGRKGPAFSHRACLETIASFRAALGLTSADWFVATMRPGMALFGMWALAPLLCGSRLILAPAQEPDANDFAFDQLERSRAVVLEAAPRIATELVNAGWQSRTRLKLVAETDPWPAELVSKLENLGVEVWQLRGSPANYQILRSYPTANTAGSNLTPQSTQS
jgi:non-ribosomal peptide synthetase component F